MLTLQSPGRYLSELFSLLGNRRRAGTSDVFEASSWQRVDRAIGEIKQRLASAGTEEQFQAIGLLCREALISVAQAVYDPDRHRPLDGKTPSPTDAKRMLEAYVAAELPREGNEESRKHLRSALALALALQHRRTAAFREAAVCAEAVTGLIEMVAIVAGRRDPR